MQTTNTANAVELCEIQDHTQTNNTSNNAISSEPPLDRAPSAIAMPLKLNRHAIESMGDQNENEFTTPLSTKPNQLHDILLYEIGNKWKKLFFNAVFCGRILALILTLLLLTLSITYCVAQLLTVKLELIKKCEPKEPKEIWHHSFLSASYDRNNEIILDAQSQYGLTDESCWTTKDIDTSTEQLWFSNQYYHQWTPNYDIKFAMFIILSSYCFGVIIYAIYAIIMDIYHIKCCNLHTKSKKYKQLKATPKLKKKFATKHTFIQRVELFYKKYLADDTTVWIIRSVCSEVSELIIQSQALLLYNGYHVFDKQNKDNVYLANKPEYIIIFAVIISFNAFGSGVLWLSYSLAHKKCHSLIFRLSIFFIDQFSDLFYTIFPFIIVFTDNYNVNHHNLVLLGQLNVDSALPFFSAFIPLLFLCSKSFFIIRSSTLELRNQYFSEWEIVRRLLQKSDNKQLVSDALRKGNNMDEYLFDSNGNLIDSSLQRITSKKNWIDKNELAPKRNTYIKQIILTIAALVYIIFGIVILTVVIKHINNAKTYCNSINEINYININGTFDKNIRITQEQMNTFQLNPELFFWDKCLYQTYPFTNVEKLRCQCRVFVIDWSNLQSSVEDRVSNFNVTQTKILTGMLENWIMLEKFRTHGSEGSFHELDFIFSAEMFKSVHMKAFEWNSASIDSFETGVSTWKKLEYLRFEDTAGGVAEMPADFGGLTQMKYLSFISSGLQSIPVSICDLTELQVIQIEWETNIEFVPNCINNLQNLRIILIDGCFKLQHIPLSMFTLPNLKILSLFRGSISYDSIIDYNLPITININDTDMVQQWMNDNFAFSDAEYYLSRNPICYEDLTSFPFTLQQFINNSGTCDYLCEEEDLYDTFCIPRDLGNGRCDEHCNIPNCKYDNGDCMQLCFAPEITNCSWEKLINDKCDDGCNNKYCSGYEWQSDFSTPAVTTKGPEDTYYSFDLFNCPVNLTNDENKITNQTCEESVTDNIYIDQNVPVDEYSLCPVEWIGDGECDDTCRTEECLNDNGDCELGCNGDTCNTIYQFWLFLGEADVYKVDQVTVCNNIWPVALAYFKVEDSGNCNVTFIEFDYNQDKHINFREFVALAYDFAGADATKGPQVNCSECIGMDYYNI